MKNKIIGRMLLCVMAIWSGVIFGMDDFSLSAPIRTTQLAYSVVEINQKTKGLELFGLSCDAGEQTLRMYPKDKPYKSFLLTLGDVRVIKNTLDDLEGKDFNVCVQPYVFRMDKDDVISDKIVYQEQECLVNRKDFYTAYHQLFPVENGSKAKKLSQTSSRIVSQSNNQEEWDLSFLHENDNAPKLSKDPRRSYGNIYCSLPGATKNNPVSAVICVCPTNSYQLQIVPTSNPNQKIDGTWMMNKYALSLDGEMMESISREIWDLLKQHSDAKRCVISLTESSKQGHRSLLYEIDMQSYRDQYTELLAQEENRQARIQKAVRSRAALQLTEEEKQEEAVRSKWAYYQEMRFKRNMEKNDSMSGSLITCSDKNQHPYLTLQEATLIIAKDCYYVSYGKGCTSTTPEQWLSIPIATTTLDEMRKKKEPFYMYAIQVSDKTLHYALKITKVIDRAPDVRSSQIIYGIEEGPLKTKTWSAKSLFAGAITIGGGVALFIYMLHRLGYLSASLTS